MRARPRISMHILCPCYLMPMHNVHSRRGLPLLHGVTSTLRREMSLKKPSSTQILANMGTVGE